MSFKRVKRNLNKLNQLYKASPKNRIALLKKAKPDLTHAICDCLVNEAKWIIPLNSKQINALRRKRNVVKKLANTKAKSLQKKKLLTYNMEKD